MWLPLFPMNSALHLGFPVLEQPQKDPTAENQSENQGSHFSHYGFFQTCYQLLPFTAHLSEAVSTLACVLQKIHLQDTNNEHSRELPHSIKEN